MKPFDLCGVAFARVGKPITLDEIRAVEVELKRDFPPEYRWLLTQANGALFQSRGLLAKGLFPELYEREENEDEPDDEDEPDSEGYEIRLHLMPLRARDCLHTADDQDASHDAGEERQFLNYSVSDAAEWYHDGSSMPLHSVPIGSIDGFGCDGTGFLLLGCRGPRRGKLAAFDHGEKPLNLTLPELFVKLGQSDARPRTPGQALADAVAARDLDAVRAAVAAGGAKSETTRDGRWPLREACQAGFDDAVLAIAEAGDRAKVIAEALMAGRLAVARQVFDATPELKRDELKEMLFDAAIYREVSFVEAVIDRGVKIDKLLTPKRNGYSLVQVAVRAGSVPGLEFLLSRGGQLDSVDFESGATLLHETAGGHQAEPAMARFLIERGVPRDAGDAGGRTALHLAITAGNAAVAKALIDAGASLDCRATINSPQMRDPRTQQMLKKALGEWESFAAELGDTLEVDLDAEDAPRPDPADPAAAQALDLAGLAGQLQANLAGLLPVVRAQLSGGERLGQPAANLATHPDPRVRELVEELRVYAAGK